MRTRARRACSVALRIASGTSRALPEPWPTRPLRSPTTTRAAKPKRRPPFTTLATRLMLTSFSTNSPSAADSASRSRPRGRRSRAGRSLRSPSPSLRRGGPPAVRDPGVRAMMSSSFLELQAALAGGVGQGLDPAMEQVAAAVEHHRSDAGGLRPFGEQLADRRRGILVGTGLGARPQGLVEARRGHQRAAALVVDHLRVDVLGRAENGQPRTALDRAADAIADALLAAGEEIDGFAAHRRTYFFLPSLRRMTSVA